MCSKSCVFCLILFPHVRDCCPVQSRGGLLEIPGLIAPQDFTRLGAQVIADSQKLFRDTESQFPLNPKLTVHVLDSISNMLCKVADPAELIRYFFTMPSPVRDYSCSGANCLSITGMYTQTQSGVLRQTKQHS